MTISWYSIRISLQSVEDACFNGYFIVDNDTHLVTAFYETINGSTDFNNNILIPTGTGVATGSYLGFTHYDAAFATYDNVYLPSWFQFDTYGVVIHSMSAYPHYNQFNLWAHNVGDESIHNIGIIGNNDMLYSVFTITPIQPIPIIPTMFFHTIRDVLIPAVSSEVLPEQNNNTLTYAHVHR